MNPHSFSDFLAHRSGIILTGQITITQLYNTYTAFCVSKGHTPDTYEAVEAHLANRHLRNQNCVGVQSHITSGKGVLGRYVSADLDRACQ